MGVRNSDWSLGFLERVEQSPWKMAWDQSMFFWEILRAGGLLDGQSMLRGDFQMPPEVAYVHQAHLNAFTEPVARDWHAYQWQLGDMVLHFAGCPFQERECSTMMAATAALSREQWAGVNGTAWLEVKEET